MKLLMSISGQVQLSDNDVFNNLCAGFAHMRRTFSRTQVPTVELLTAILKMGLSIPLECFSTPYADLDYKQRLAFGDKLNAGLDVCSEYANGVDEPELEDFKHESYNIWRAAVTDANALCGLPTDYPSIEYADEYIRAFRSFLELVGFAKTVRTRDVGTALVKMRRMSPQARHLIPTSTIHLLT